MALPKNKIIKIVVDAAKKYEDILNNRVFLIVYKVGNTLEFRELKFDQRNFKHLTGVDSALSPKQFYQAALKGKLALNDVREKSDGTTALKLQILPQLHQLISMPTMIGEFESLRIHLQADKALGTTIKVSLALGDDKGISVPKSLLKEDIRRLTCQPYPVMRVYCRKNKEEKYSMITYNSHKLNLPIPKEIEWLLNDELINE